MMIRCVMVLTLFFFGLLWNRAVAHDTWLEAGARSVPIGEYTHVSLMLGNHGNDHRDFKLASKISLDPCKVWVVTPPGQVEDLKPRLIDMGSAPKEGYWTVRYQFSVPGVHHFIHTLDTLHGTTRAIKSAKTFVEATAGGGVGDIPGDADRSHRFGLELVLRGPISAVRVGEPLEVQVVRSGTPLADATVTFIPRGVSLAEGFDEQYQRISDPQGMVRFVPAQANIFLVVVHHLAAEEQGDGFDRTHYSAAMVLQVPDRTLQGN
jgi:uncharacterized GH25 family protein